MDLQPGLSRRASLDVGETVDWATEAGFATFVLPAEGVVDTASFFDAVRATLPLDPPLVGTRSWDAMADSLWEGLFALPQRRVAILWPNARTMAHRAPSDFEMALNVLADVAHLLADAEATCGNPKDVAVVVEQVSRVETPEPPK